MALSISLVTSSYLLPPGHQDPAGRRWAGQDAWRPYSCWSQRWPIPPLSCLSLLALPGYAICLMAAVICLLPTDTCSPDLSHTPDPRKRHHFNVTTSTIEHCVFRLSGPPLRAPLGMWVPTCPSHRWHVNQASSYHRPNASRTRPLDDLSHHLDPSSTVHSGQSQCVNPTVTLRPHRQCDEAPWHSQKGTGTPSVPPASSQRLPKTQVPSPAARTQLPEEHPPVTYIPFEVCIVDPRRTPGIAGTHWSPIQMSTRPLQILLALICLCVHLSAPRPDRCLCDLCFLSPE